jgi:hypothetical protein
MKKLMLVAAAALLALAATAAWQGTAQKLPKCSKSLCLASGCSPSELCLKGAAVVTCADICKGHH